MTVLVFCPNLVGDSVMATPAIRAIREARPSDRLVAVAKPQAAATLDGVPWLDAFILHDPKSKDRSRRSMAVIKQMRAERADLAVLFPNSFRSALLAIASGARRRVGYDRGGRGMLLTDRLAVPRDEQGRRQPIPAIEYYLAIVKRLGDPVASLRPELATSPEDEAAADRAWEALGIPRDAPLVCFNTGGAFGPAKNWPEEHFVALGQRIVDELGARVLVVCGPGERDAARAIAAQSGRPEIVSLAGQPLGIGLTKACVRRSTLMVTTDSGPRHFAVAFGVPVVTLFGPTHIAWTRTHHPLAVHLKHPVPCGPCQKPVCPVGHHRCMTELSPDAVFRAVARMWPRRVCLAV